MYLTPKELAYVSDTDFLITKRSIQQKINSLLVRTEEVLKVHIQDQALSFPDEASFRAGKIARGENYQNLPYQILDYPRLFQRDDVFALRTMFWWGHFYSATLHLQGKSWEMYQAVIHQKQDQLKQRGFYLCVHKSPWEYHRGEKNYRKLDTLSIQEIDQYLNNMHFLKIAAFLSLEDGDKLPEFVLGFFRFFSDILEL